MGPVKAEAVSNVERSARFRTPNRTLLLPAYDVRVRRELAQRRLLLALGRQIARVLGLHLVDTATILISALVAAGLTRFTDATHFILPIAGFTLLGLNARGAYRSTHGRREQSRIVTGVAVAALALVITTAFPAFADVSAPFLALYVVFVTLALLSERYLVDLAVRQAYAHGIGLRKAVIVGRQSDVHRVARALEADGNHCVVGFVTPNRVHDAKALGSIDEIEAVLDHADPEELIVSGSLDADVLRRVANACVKRGIAMLAVPSWSRAIRGWAEPVKVGRLPGYQLHPTRLAMPSLALKRATDLVVASVGLVVCAPVIALVAVAIKIDSRGPVFYRQRRVGLAGREFTMWKFRSMQLAAAESQTEIAHLNPYQDGRLFKLKADPRVTQVGRVLRRFSLDELPQLLNVLSGDMSIVGPRPPVPAEVGKYEPRHFVRLSVVPGITGPWQVNGRNLITDFEEVVRLEKSYVEGWSFGLDLQIMVRTVGVVLSGKGAY